MCRQLIEDGGVDPRHIDCYGNTAREKAELYQFVELADYLRIKEEEAKAGQLKIGDFSLFQRSGKNRCFLDY